MTDKIISGECLSCESSYNVEYIEELVSEEFPEHCPFCGEVIDELTEAVEDDEDGDEDDSDEDKWD
jgi:hypothetical protein